MEYLKLKKRLSATAKNFQEKGTLHFLHWLFFPHSDNADRH